MKDHKSFEMASKNYPPVGLPPSMPHLPSVTYENYRGFEKLFFLEFSNFYTRCF